MIKSRFSEVRNEVWKDEKIISNKQSLIDSLTVIYNLEFANSLEMAVTMANTVEIQDRNLGVVPCVIRKYCSLRGAVTIAWFKSFIHVYFRCANILALLADGQGWAKHCIFIDLDWISTNQFYRLSEDCGQTRVCDIQSLIHTPLVYLDKWLKIVDFADKKFKYLLEILVLE